MKTKPFTVLVALSALLLLAIPMYGRLYAPDTKGVYFYGAPLVCSAAPAIGCGSKAKFLLVDLEKHSEAVEGAWLNRQGTVVAVKWRGAVSADKREVVLKAVGTAHNSTLTALAPKEQASLSGSFPDRKDWFKGREVDELSKEEARIIAKNTMKGYREKQLLKPSFEKQFEADVEKIYADLFLSLSSYKDLNTETYNRVEAQIQTAGEKYVGAGNMPRVELCIAPKLDGAKGESCTQATGKSCCDKN
ncbi:hypothetical protein GU926_11290 [Nibribacter ruber]|uniref:Uncharacterized protein n=1 Tax=Nibribacter ruber TaxID=2698458 RepID=A0A6P1P0S4_9BACT|nr:hypothetical protein [Nibribacter ruber]QHL87981.1 hypothetical protein GU926_11290 [Nibribacter ruber]